MLIGITGAARSGKNSVATILAELADFQIVGFADALRAMALGIDPLIDVRMECEPDLKLRTHSIRYAELVNDLGYERAKELPEVRRFLQRLGTEGGRKVFGTNFWVNRAAERVLPLLRAGRNVVMPDVRFANEAKFIHDTGGWLWRTVRAGHDNALGTNAQHASETEMQSIEAAHTLTAANVDELRAEVERVYQLQTQQRYQPSGAR